MDKWIGGNDEMMMMIMMIMTMTSLLQRVISWSSLDWDQGRWNQLDLVIGTTFDLSVHIANT